MSTVRLVKSQQTITSLKILLIIIAGTLWCMAMHAFSAVPDIVSDKKAGISTIATKLGAKVTIIFCFVCYILAAAMTIKYLGIFSTISASFYSIMMILAYMSESEEQLFKIYKIFPYLNVTIGFLLFWVIYFI